MEFNKVQTEQQALELIRIMPEVVAIDTEYVKGDPKTTQLLSVIVAGGDIAWAIDPSLLPMLTPTVRSRKIVFLQDYNHCDTTILLKNGCDLRETNCHNLIDMHHILDENAEHDLGSRTNFSFSDNYKSEFWSRYSNFEDAPEQDALEYQCKDAIYTYRLGMQDYIQIKDKYVQLYEHIRQLSSSLFETELTGLPVNVKLIEDTKKTMGEEIASHLPVLKDTFKEYCTIRELQKYCKVIEKYKTEASQLKHRPVFNFDSHDDIRWLVYEGLGCPVLRKTPVKVSKKTGKRGGGNPSTDYDALEELSRDYPELLPLLKYREVQSIYDTFVVGMLDRVKNGRIYPHFNVSGTATGRISHSDPNMGNLPKEGVIRNFFVASPGMAIIGADYAQLEVVVEANLTNDPQLLKIILEGASKHDITAQGLGIDRNSAKTLNFALQYGAGVRKVSKILGVSDREANDIFTRYWELYRGVKALKDKTSELLKTSGQVTNIAGRTRRFPKTNNPFELAKQERQAYNFLIQGVAAEACNRAYYRFASQLKENGGVGRALFSVHDEIVAEVENDGQCPEFFKTSLVRIMEQSTPDFNFKYPLKAQSYGPYDCWRKT